MITKVDKLDDLIWWHYSPRANWVGYSCSSCGMELRAGTRPLKLVDRDRRIEAILCQDCARRQVPAVSLLPAAVVTESL